MSDILEFPRRGAPDLGLETDAWLDRLRDAREREPLGRLGPFELLREVGRGGQGIVYRARDTRSGDIVALKRLLVSDRRPGGAHARLRNEVAAMRALAHPGVVRVRGIEADGGSLFIAMDWIDGAPLSDWSLAARRDPRAVARLMAQVCRVMAHAHARGVVHRDLKPSNVLVGADGAPHVLDFGLAKLLSEEGAGASASSPFLGTLAYAAPELIAFGPGAVDARSDIYSMGVMLHEALTGTLPYGLGGSISTAVTAILRARPAALDDGRIDPRLRAVLERALAKAPEARFADAAGMGTALEAWLSEGHVRAAAPARPWRAMPVAAGALLACMAAAGFLEDRPRGPASGPLADMRAPRDHTAASAASAIEAAVPAAAAAHLDRAWEHLARGDWPGVAAQAARARSILEAGALTSGHRYAAALTLLGAAWVRTSGGDPGPLLDRAIELERAAENPDPGLLGEAHTARALHQVATGAFHDAEADWALAFAAFGQSGGHPGGARRSLIAYARMKARIGDGEAAVRGYEHAIAAMEAPPAADVPARGRILIEYGDVLRSLGRVDAARAAYRRSIDVRAGVPDETLPMAWSKFGSCQLDAGEPVLAEAAFVTAIRTRLDLLSTSSPGERRFAAFSQSLAGGFGAEDVVPIGQLLREGAPPILGLFRFTAFEMARAVEAQGRAADAAAIRREIARLDALAEDVLPPAGAGVSAASVR